jgi:hypothetical protein
MNKVEHYSVMLCDALYMSMKSWTLRLHENAAANGDNVDYHINKIEEIKENGVDVEFYLESGRKYYKLIHKDGISRSVHCFIDKNNGDVYKSASWKSPAKGVRYNLLDDNSRELCYSKCDPFGSYLYQR